MVQLIFGKLNINIKLTSITSNSYNSITLKPQLHAVNTL